MVNTDPALWQMDGRGLQDVDNEEAVTIGM